MLRGEDGKGGVVEVYSPVARRLHWLTVAFVAVQVPIGFIRVWRGKTLNIWDGVTTTLYSMHKLIGFVILWLVVVRLVYRFTRGAPADEPTLTGWQRTLAHVTHWGLYGLLLAVPLSGWVGISFFGARDIFGLVSLPAIVPEDADAAGRVFFAHWVLASLLVSVIAAHVGAALYHFLVRRDGVLSRMLPGIGRRT